MRKTVTKTECTCDFCGRKSDPEDYLSADSFGEFTMPAVDKIVYLGETDLFGGYIPQTTREHLGSVTVDLCVECQLRMAMFVRITTKGGDHIASLAPGDGVYPIMNPGEGKTVTRPAEDQGEDD